MCNIHGSPFILNICFPLLPLVVISADIPNVDGAPSNSFFSLSLFVQTGQHSKYKINFLSISPKQLVNKQLVSVLPFKLFFFTKVNKFLKGKWMKKKIPSKPTNKKRLVLILTCLSKLRICWGINWASHSMIALDQFYSERTVFKTCKIKNN